MGRLVLALGLGLLAVGAGRMWWGATRVQEFDDRAAGVRMVESEFASGQNYLIWGALFTGLGFPRGRRGPGEEPIVPFAQVRRVRVMQDE